MAILQIINNTKNFKINGEHSNNTAVFNTKKIPAVTIVAAWIRAETGVGPSIASGNQICSPSWADFPIAAKHNQKHMNSTTFTSKK